MTNPPRVKGTRAESAAAKWLTDEFGVPVTRGPLRGNQDRGDLFGIPDHTIEVKNTKVPALAQWGRELRAEQVNNATGDAVVLWSPPGVGMSSVDRWLALEWYWECHAPTPGKTVPHVGPLNGLHKFVTVMDEHGYATFLFAGQAMVVARLVSSWASEVRERWPHLTRRSEAI